MIWGRILCFLTRRHKWSRAVLLTGIDGQHWIKKCRRCGAQTPVQKRKVA